MATHFTGPVLNKEKGEDKARAWFSKLPIGLDPSYVIYFNDFISPQDYAASDWTVTTTEAGSGSATEALAADELGGALAITNDDADDDSDSLEAVHEVFKLQAGKKAWMSARVKVSDADAVDMFMGLAVNNSGDVLGAADRVGFQINDGDESILCKSEKDGTETSTDSGQDASDDTYIKLEMRYDGGAGLMFYIDDEHVATHTSNIPNDENIAVAMQIVNGAAAAKVLTVDYIFVAQER